MSPPAERRVAPLPDQPPTTPVNFVELASVLWQALRVVTENQARLEARLEASSPERQMNHAGPVVLDYPGQELGEAAPLPHAPPV